MEKEPKVAIILLNWNGKDDTIECLNSLKKIHYTNYEVIVVDNGSEGDDVQVLRKKFGDYIHLIENEENLGFAGGNNVGIRYAMDSEVDYILLLNNDTIVNEDFLNELIKVAERDEKTGILSPRLIRPDGSLQNVGGMMRPGFVELFMGLDSIWKKFGFEIKSRKSIRDSKDIVFVDKVFGTCMLIKSKVINDIGLLDPNFFPAYGEDEDFSYRARKAGYRIAYVPQSNVVHLKAKSADKIENRYLYYVCKKNILRNKLLNYPLHFLLLDVPYEIAEFVTALSENRGKEWLRAYQDILSSLDEIKSKRRNRL